MVAGLCVLAGFYTECFMGCLLCGTALIVVFQIQSMSDEQSRSSLVIQGILSLLFSLSAGHFMAYLAFYEVRIERTDGNRKSTEEHGRGGSCHRYRKKEDCRKDCGRTSLDGRDCISTMWPLWDWPFVM